MKSRFAGCVLLAVAAAVAIWPIGARAATLCPPDPIPGSKIDGGLEVDGTCLVKGVTVDGGITVDPTGHLSLQNSTANGGIRVSPGGELDVNATTNGGGVPTGTLSTINGGIVIHGGTSGFDLDIWTARINGGILVTGAFPFAFPVICGNEITGGVTLKDVTSGFGFFLGDPDLSIAGHPCTGNMIIGGLSVSHSSTVKVEANTVVGSVFLSGSTLELNGNTIGGSLKCSNGTVILPGEGPDPLGNTVHGANHCP